MPDYQVESPDTGTVYTVSATERTNLVARGYRDVTAPSSQPEPTRPSRRPQPTQQPAQQPPQPSGQSPGPASQNPTDTAQS